MLASMMISQRSLDFGAKVLEGHDFYREAHQEIFRAIVAVGKPDRMLVSEKVVRSKRLAQVGGVGYLGQIADYLQVEGSFEHYAQIVKDRAVRRRNIAEGHRTSADMMDLDRPVLNGEWSKHQRLTGEQFGKAFKPVELEHLIDPYFVKGKPHLWDADGGTQKTSFLVYVAAMLSRGKNPLTSEDCEPVRTLYFHKGEDTNAELETVYRANNGDPQMIEWHQHIDLYLDDHGIELIGNTIVDFRAGFCTFDAFFYFMPPDLKNMNDNMPALRVMQKMLPMLTETKCCEASLRHTSKGKLGKDANELGMGSQQFKNSHRGQLVARYDPNDTSDNKRVIVTDEKGSLLNRKGKPFAFRRDGLEVQIIREEIVNPFIGAEEEAYMKRDRRGRAPQKMDECKRWLVEFLGQAAVRRDAVIERGAEAGFKERMIQDARAELELSSANQPQVGAGRPYSWWALPDFDWSKTMASWKPQPDLGVDEPPPHSDADAPSDELDPFVEPFPD